MGSTNPSQLDDNEDILCALNDLFRERCRAEAALSEAHARYKLSESRWNDSSNIQISLETHQSDLTDRKAASLLSAWFRHAATLIGISIQSACFHIIVSWSSHLRLP